MSNRLSHSALNKYQDCPKAYDLHYNKRLRSKTTSSALLFGSAIDKALETLVQTKDLQKAKEVFKAQWEEQEINGVPEKLKTSTLLVYANSDFDADLLPEATNSAQEKYLTEIEDIYTKKQDSGYDSLSAEEKELFNSANWLIMERKGLLMIETVNEEVLPRLTKIHATQERIDMENENGDSMVGFIDLVADWDDIGSPVVFDFKTSSQPYAKDSVKTSQQLSLYVSAVGEKYNTRRAGYIVLSKKLQKNRTKICIKCCHDGTGGRHKTCDNEIPITKDNEVVDFERCNGAWKETLNPKANVDIIVDTIPTKMENLVIENAGEINTAIAHKVFPRNLNSCVKPYGKCTFYNLCHNNSKEDLVEAPEKK